MAFWRLLIGFFFMARTKPGPPKRQATIRGRAAGTSRFPFPRAVGCAGFCPRNRFPAHAFLTRPRLLLCALCVLCGFPFPCNSRGADGAAPSPDPLVLFVLLCFPASGSPGTARPTSPDGAGPSHCGYVISTGQSLGGRPSPAAAARGDTRPPCKPCDDLWPGQWKWTRKSASLPFRQDAAPPGTRFFTIRIKAPCRARLPPGTLPRAPPEFHRAGIVRSPGRAAPTPPRDSPPGKPSGP